MARPRADVANAHPRECVHALRRPRAHWPIAPPSPAVAVPKLAVGTASQVHSAPVSSTAQLWQSPALTSTARHPPLDEKRPTAFGKRQALFLPVPSS